MNLLQFLTGRLAKGILVLFAIAVLNFFLIRAAPGDPAQVLAGEAGAADAQLLEQLRARFGLDQPLLTQLWIYLKGYMTLDLGFSYRQQQPVLDLILDRLPATLLLTGAAFVVSLVLGVMMGALAARRAGRWSDSLITTLALIFYATPLFWIALMSQIVFALKLGLVPNVGYEIDRRELYRPRAGARHRPAPDPAGADARPVLHRALRPDDARLDAGGRGRRFRQDGARQGAFARPSSRAAMSRATRSCRW